MTENFKRQSAKIYQLSDARVTRKGAAKQAVEMRSSVAAPEFVRSDFGNGWYHDAAIAEEERLRKH